MPDQASVTTWIEALKNQDDGAAGKLWERYFHDLMQLARNNIESHYRRVADEEDAALDALNTFCRRAKDGEYPGLEDRDGLWALLAEITLCKVADQVKRERRQKRGGGEVRGESVFERPHGSDPPGMAECCIDRQPTPEAAAQFAELFALLLERLPSDRHRQVAILHLKGHEDKEIAPAIDRSVRTVERKLQEVRALWRTLTST